MGGTRGSPPSAVPTSLTWGGHEFLDAARDEGRWRDVIQTAKSAAGTVTLGVLQQLLVSRIKAAVGLGG